MGITDEQIIASYRRNKSYTGTGRELNISKQRVERRVLKLRADGIDLPPARIGRPRKDDDHERDRL